MKEKPKFSREHCTTEENKSLEPNHKKHLVSLSDTVEDCYGKEFQRNGVEHRKAHKEIQEISWMSWDIKLMSRKSKLKLMEYLNVKKWIREKNYRESTFSETNNSLIPKVDRDCIHIPTSKTSLCLTNWCRNLQQNLSKPS